MPLASPLTADDVDSLISSSATLYSSTFKVPSATKISTSSEEKKDDDNKAEFLLRSRREINNKTILTRQPMPSSPAIYFWTHRPTNSDVVSVINTSAAIDPVTLEPISGRLDPVTLRTERAQLLAKSDTVCGRGSGGVKGFKVSAYESPLETHNMLGRDEHERMNKALHDERNEFFKTKFQNKAQREANELVAAVMIQRIARVFLVRLSLKGWLQKKLRVRNNLSSQVRFHLSKEEETKGYILTKRQFRDKTHSDNYSASNKIISLWRKFAAMRKVDAIRAAVYHKLLEDSAAKIQSIQRRKLGQKAVTLERERIKNERLQVGANVLQRQYRGFQARKVVGAKRKERHDNAVEILQRGGRVFVARKKVDHQRKKLNEDIKNKAAATITKFFRVMYGRSRGKKIRQITEKFIREASTVKIQCFARQRLAYRVVKRALFIKKYSARLCAIINIQRIGRAYLAKKVSRLREEAALEVSEVFAKVRENDEEGVEHFISYKNDDQASKSMPNDVDHNGDTVLAIAAGRGLLQVVRKCLLWGTDPNIKNKRGRTAMEIAVQRYQPVAAEYLLSKVSVKFNTEGLTLLHDAATSGMGRFALSLLENGVNSNCHHPITGRTPLHDAAVAALREGKIFFDNMSEQDSDFDEEEQNTFATKHAVVIQHLLANGADVMLTDNQGYTALHYAAEVGNIACIRNIIASKDGKECLAKKDAHGRTAWVIATMQSHTMSANLLWEHVSDMDNEVIQIHPNDATLFAVGLTTPDTTMPRTFRKKLQAVEKFDSKARAEKITRLVTWAKIPVDVVCPLHETTAVMNAAKNGNSAAFETCLRMGAGLARQDDDGRNAVHFLCGTHDIIAGAQMLDLCLEPIESVAAGDQNMEHALAVKDADGRCAIHYAAFRSNVEVINKIQNTNNNRCSVHSKDNEGNTPLHYVCGINDDTYGDVLDSFGFNSSMDHYVVPPVDFALTSTIRQLRRLGANPETENNAGKSPLMLACESGNLNAIKCLLGDWKEMRDIAKSLTHMACYAIESGRMDCLKEIVTHEKFTAANAHSTGAGGISLLGVAIKSRRVAMINYLLEELQVNPTKQCWDGGGNALHALGRWGNKGTTDAVMKHPKIVPTLYERKNTQGSTPLMLAVKNRNYEVCIKLVKKGASTTLVARMWCASFLLSACLTQQMSGNAKMPTAMYWRDRKFYVYGLQGESGLGDIAAPTKSATPIGKKRIVKKSSTPESKSRGSSSRGNRGSKGKSPPKSPPRKLEGSV